MSIFIDTGIFIAYLNKKDVHHDAALTLMEDIMNNNYGPVFTSDSVFNETVTFVLYKTGDIHKTGLVRNLIFGTEDIPRFMDLLYIDEHIIVNAWNTFVRYADKKMSFTDCSIIELMRYKGIEYIASFDSDFDGIMSRLDC